ncbi:hypothetical protein M3F59_12725 [Brachybacterium muris]|uniref:hypothetical protein n=1 Tax=Brachybacterium muris TaxID=219301 RepID=UPI00223BA7FA|nr:hypothetical protein [Brachybacterium muris]MCT2262467.1 hypothetical protein [Brachybacterium muris]
MSTSISPAGTTERISFPDGDHLTISVEDPGYVDVDGHIEGEDVGMSLRSDLALEDGRLLTIGAHDALWTRDRERNRRIGDALIAAASLAQSLADHADTSERVALDGGHADVDGIDQHVELTVTLGGRATIGLALTTGEARKIAHALMGAAHRAEVSRAMQLNLSGVETVTDLFNTAQDTGVPASALVEVIGR